MTQPEPRRWFRKPANFVKVTAELIVEIDNASALEQAALKAADEIDTDEEDKAAMSVAVRGNPAEAVLMLADPFAMLADAEGVNANSSEHGAQICDEDGNEGVEIPDFVALDEVCRCGRESCEECSGWQFTPRSAAALWLLAGVFADHAYDDLEQHGDDQVADHEGEWSIFDEYPKITWRENAVWRRQAARAFDDLSDDLEAGRWPHPRCVGEEMALHLMLQSVEASVKDDWSGWWAKGGAFAELPTHKDDFDWNLAFEVFFKDADIEQLFDPALDGIEDPDEEINRFLRMGDYRPPAWFKPFDTAEPRDGRRGFRR